MKSRAFLVTLIGIFLCLVAIGLSPRKIVEAQTSVGTTTRISVDSFGAQGNNSSDLPAISADGRFVAFRSEASDLVAGDTNATSDIFVHDRQTGETTRVSVNSSGAQVIIGAFFPEISADGRFVLFYSDDSNLVPGDTNGEGDIFVHDRQTGATTRISVDSSGAQGNGVSAYAAISADGRFVAFMSDASNLVPGDTNGQFDIFVHDRQTGATTRVSVDSSGAQGNEYSHVPAISADGRFVAFPSNSTNLVPDDTNGHTDIFVHDRQTGATTRVSVDSSGTQGNSLSDDPTISADGRFVAFKSGASNLVPGDTNSQPDIFVHDRQTGATSGISVDFSGALGKWHVGESRISADGRFVAFAAWSYLFPGGYEARDEIFVHDRQTGVTSRVSVDSYGAKGNGDSFGTAISADGRFVAFQSFASNLVPEDTNGYSDIFVHERSGSILWDFTDLVATPGPAAGMVNMFWSVPQNATSSMRLAMRYRTGGPIMTESDWQLATPIRGLPRPYPGQTQSFTVKGLDPGQTYYFAARLEYVPGKLWPLSNSPSAVATSPIPIDLTVSLWRMAGDDEAKYEEIFYHFADAIYEMSNGAHIIRTITVYQNKEQWELADVQWHESIDRANADMTGYGYPNYHVRTGDKRGNIDMLNSDLNRRATGYSLAHEWGHYYYGLYDEYKDSTKVCTFLRPSYACKDDIDVHHSIMSTYNKYKQTPLPDDFGWLNFSIPANFYKVPTAQRRVFGLSGWETLTRANVPLGKLKEWHANANRRKFYPELVAVAPKDGQSSPKELPDARSFARSALNVNWVETSAASAAIGNSSNSNFSAYVTAIPKTDVSYPQPVALVANVSNFERIAWAGISTSAIAPNGQPIAISLLDDGVSPDEIAEDGLYSGFLPYTQDGEHQITVTFDNDAGTAAYIQLGMLGYPDPGFELVGEAFSVTTTTTVTVSGMAPDDHGDMAATASAVPADNSDLTGRIDRPGDIDWFVVTPETSGRLAVRVANLGLGMTPRLRLLAGDGSTVLADITEPPIGNPYLFYVIEATAEQPVFVEVSDTDPTAVSGFYDVRAGTPQPNEAVAVAGPPQISGFEPYGAAVGMGVNITGVDLIDVESLTFNGVAAVFVPISDIKLYAEVPIGATSGPIAVTTTRGFTSNLIDFIVVAGAPTITGFAPSNASPGEMITVTGTNLETVTGILFDNEETVTFFAISDTEIRVAVPAGATTGKIAVTTLGGTAQSVDDFIVVINQSPNEPANPDPSDGAMNVPITANLSWSATDPDNDPLTYEVRFGTTNPPPQVVASQTGTTYDPAGELNYSTTYYWQIVADDGRGGVTPGPVWSFTTEAAPPQTQTLTLTPIADAYTSSANPTTRYGTATTLRVKEAAADLYSFLKFDPGALACAQVEGATLRLYVTDAGSNAGSLYAVDSNWTEGTITWNNDPPISGTPLATPGAAPLNTWVEFDVTAGVALGGPFSFGLKGNVSDIVYYNSRESARPPELVVEYTELPGTTPTAAFSAAPLSGYAPLTVNFSDSSTGCPTSYEWSFGDGATSTEANPTHTYIAPGTYTVSLTAGNGQGSDTETKTGYITVSEAPPEPDVYISPAASATIGGIPSTPADILRYTKSTNTWTMVYDGSVRGTAKNVSAFHIMDDGSLLLVFAANQVIANLGTATPYDVVRFKPNNPGVFPLGPGTYNWVFQGKPRGLTTTGEKIDAMDLAGDRLLLSTTGAAKLPLLPSGALSAPDEDVFAFNLTTGRWETALVIDGSLIPGLGGEDLASIWDDPNSDDYYITIVGAFTIGGVKGNGKSIVKLTPNGGATVYTPSLVTWLTAGATFPTNLDGLALRP